MMYSSDFRSIARIVLRGKWCRSALTYFLASLIGAGIATGGRGQYFESGDSSGSAQPPDGAAITYLFDQNLVNYFRSFLGILIGIGFIGLIISLIIGGAGKLGYAKYNLGLVDGRNSRVEDLISQFHRLGDGFLMNLLMGIYTFLWSLLFVIPGIVKTFSYAMTPYILYEHPEYTVNEAITRSREIMDGNKFALFCLNFSFIGWSLLIGVSGAVALCGVLLGQFWTFSVVAVCVIAELFLGAYTEAANAAFYRHISYVPTAYDTTSETDETGGAF